MNPVLRNGGAGGWSIPPALKRRATLPAVFAASCNSRRTRLAEFRRSSSIERSHPVAGGAHDQAAIGGNHFTSEAFAIDRVLLRELVPGIER